MLKSLALAACLVAAPSPSDVPYAERCSVWKITGYNRHAGSNWTADGTSVWTREPLIAAPGWVPFDTMITVADLGTYRVADRGHLAENNLDILVDSDAEAYDLTSTRTACLH